MKKYLLFSYVAEVGDYEDIDYDDVREQIGSGIADLYNVETAPEGYDRDLQTL